MARQITFICRQRGNCRNGLTSVCSVPARSATRTLAYSAVIVALLWITPAWSCVEQAQTELERVFCQIKQRSGKNLPSLGEFRQNPEKTQRLLLRRPAKKLGLTLPQAKPGPAVSSSPQPAAAKLTTPPEVNTLEDCQLLDETIRCGQQNYRLVRNIANRDLSSGALRDTVLTLPPFTADADAFQQKQQLQKYYESYIEAMLTIGLAEVTMSFTKFSYLYGDVKAQGGDFAQRMNSMFDFLKNDKAQMPVKGRQKSIFPADISYCQALNTSIVLCDNVAENWIYVK